MPSAEVLFDAFGAGVYVLLGAVQLDLWRRRPRHQGHLWLALASAGALLVDLTGMVLRAHGASAGLFVVALNHLGVAAVGGFLFELVGALAGRAPRAAARAVQAALAIAALLVGFVPALSPVVVAGSGLLLLAATYRAVRAGRHGLVEAGVVVGGFLFLTTCLTLDVLRELSLVALPGGLPILGFTVLFVTSARTLNAQAAREHAELVALREELEARVAQRTHELEQANTRLADAARVDSLTGLPNRRAFLEAFESASHRSRRSRQPISFVLGDVDHFKGVNDTRGHAAGDAVLVALADALRRSLRAQDVLARWGGEEFVALLPDTTAAGARQVAENLRATAEGLTVVRDGAPLRATMSFGVAQHDADRTLEATLAAADAALYRAKGAGRNAVRTEGEA